MAQLHLGDRTIRMSDDIAAEFQEVLFRLVSKGKSFMYTSEGNEESGSAMTVWVHPALDWSLDYDREIPPAINEARVDSIAKMVERNGRMLFPAR